MHEEILRKYFDGQASAEELADDLIGTSVRRAPREVSHGVVDMTDMFQINPVHIIRLLKDVVNGKIGLESLASISFIIIASDQFIRAHENGKDGLINQMLLEWASPEVYGVLDIDNLRRCLDKLEDSQIEESFDPFKPLAEFCFCREFNSLQVRQFSFSGKGTGSCPLYIQFNPKQKESWVGEFERGPTGYNSIRTIFNQERLYIIAGGKAYLIDVIQGNALEILDRIIAENEKLY